MNRLPASPRASRAGRCLPPNRPWPRIVSAIGASSCVWPESMVPAGCRVARSWPRGEPLPIAAGEHVNLIHVEDAAAAVLAAEAHAQPPRTYLVSDGHPVERRDIWPSSPGSSACRRLRSAIPCPAKPPAAAAATSG